MEKKVKKTNKNEQDKKKKRRRILLATLIPLGVAAVATAVAVPLVLKNKNNNSVDVEANDADGVAQASAVKTASGDVEITITSKDEGHEFKGNVEKITIGNHVLDEDEYTIQDNKIIIKKEVIDKYPEKIIVVPKMAKKTATGVKIDKNTPTVVKVDGVITTSAEISYTNEIDEISWSFTGDGSIQFVTQQGIAASTATTKNHEKLNIRGAEKGDVVIKATCGGQSDTFSLTVKDDTPVVTRELYMDASGLKDVHINIPVLVKSDEPKATYTAGAQYPIETITGYFEFTCAAASATVKSETLTLTQTETLGLEIDFTDIFTAMEAAGLKTGTVTISFIEETPVKADVNISGSHNVDSNDKTTWEFKATDKDGNDITSQCTFKSSNEEIATFKKNVLNLETLGAQCGGSIEVTATYDGKTSDPFEVEIASFSQLLTDDTQYSLQKSYATCTGKSEGYIIIPTRYYDENVAGTDKWVPTTTIAASGMADAKITGIHISSTISDIGDTPFGAGLETLQVDSKNNTYKSTGIIETKEVECNCIIKKDELGKLIFGCSKTIIPDETVTIIGSRAFFNNTKLTTITIPSNIETIESEVFAGCVNLGTVKLPEVKWAQRDLSYQEHELLSTSDASQNAINFRNVKDSGTFTGYNWGTTGIWKNDDAVKWAKVVYDKTFSDKGITMEDWLVKDKDGERDIYAYHNAVTTDRCGFITVTNTNGLSVKKGMKCFTSQQEGGVYINLSQEDWDKAILAQDTLNATFTEANYSPVVWDFTEEWTIANASKEVFDADGSRTITATMTAPTEWQGKTGILTVTNNNGTTVATSDPITFGTDPENISINVSDWTSIETFGNDSLTISINEQVVTRTLSFKTDESFPSDLTLTMGTVTSDNPTVTPTISNAYSFSAQTWCGTITYTYTPVEGDPITLTNTTPILEKGAEEQLDQLDFSSVFEKMAEESKTESEIAVSFEEAPHLNADLGTTPTIAGVDGIRLIDSKIYGSSTIIIMFEGGTQTVDVPANTYKVEVVGQSHTETIVIDKALHIDIAYMMDTFEFSLSEFAQFTEGETLTINIVSNT